MKNLFFMAAFFAAGVAGYAQNNNPYNARGVDFVKAYNTVAADFKAGKIKALDQATLDYYNRTLPGQPNATLEVASKTVEAVKKSTPYQVIDQSKLSDAAKQFLKKSLSPKVKIEELVNQVNGSTLAKAEKEFVLSSLAMTYHMKGNQTSGSPCYINGEEVPCPVAGGMIGAAVGFAICNWPCAIGGAIIGSIIGSLKD